MVNNKFEDDENDHTNVKDFITPNLYIGRKKDKKI